MFFVICIPRVFRALRSLFPETPAVPTPDKFSDPNRTGPNMLQVVLAAIFLKRVVLIPVTDSMSAMHLIISTYFLMDLDVIVIQSTSRNPPGQV